MPGQRHPQPDGEEEFEIIYGNGKQHRTEVRKRSNPSSGRSSKTERIRFEEIFNPFGEGDEEIGEFFDEDEYLDELDDSGPKIYNDPAVLDEGVHQIPGSPWAKPANRASTRPSEPLPIATYASTIAFGITIGWVVFLFIRAVWSDYSVGRVLVEVLLAIISFFGLFWNSYFTVSSIFKCFIPLKAFRTNTKYCSMIPENKPANEKWMDVTIQIPVYKESLQEVLMPTLKSCMASRDHYKQNTGANCNIVVCDDGMMALLKNNFAAAEMLWETIETTKGSVFKLSNLLRRVPRPSRRHLKGLSSHSVYEVFHRLLFYYHYDIGFVARSTHDRRGKFKKASNLNSHLRLYWGGEQVAKSENMRVEEALIQTSHNADGSRFTMFGNDISIGHLIIVNDADARMAESVIIKTVPEFLNDRFLGFTQHATKTLDDQRGESYYTNMLAAYTDALYQGHFLLSSILGCHPPLVGHSIFLRSESVKQCGRIRTLRKTQRWLNNIGLPFLSVDQVGLNNLQDSSSTEYWSENHVSEDFELMIHLYNLGFNGRYIAYPDCEFQEGITRTFDEEAGRHRKFALGAHELMFNPFNNWVGQGVFTELFKTFLKSDIPSYYKIFLTAYLFSYTSGGAYLLVFSVAAITRLVDREGEIEYLAAFNSAGVLVLSVVVYYIVGYFTFLLSMVRMKLANRFLLFPEYRDRSFCYLIFTKVRYCMFFQLLFYSVMGNYFYLGSMDHLMSRSGVVSATNKDSIDITRCRALFDVIRFNSGSWFIALYLLALGYATYLEAEDWDYTTIPEFPDDLIGSLLFAGPAVVMAVMAFIVPIILNPYVLGWPFHPPFGGCCGGSQQQKKALAQKPSNPKKSLKRSGSTGSGNKLVDLHTFMSTGADKELDKEIDRLQDRPDVELGSLATNEFGSKYPMSIGTPHTKEQLLHELKMDREREAREREARERDARERETRRPESARVRSYKQPQPAPGKENGSNRPVRKSQSMSNKQPVKLAMI